MNEKTNEQRSQELHDLLFQLAQDVNAMETREERDVLYTQFESIYFSSNGNYRHLYSDIFAWLTQIDVEENLSIDVLAQNLQILNQQYRIERTTIEDFQDISNELNKLFDHVNLDVSRINYVRNNMLSKNAVHEVENLANAAQAKIQKLEKDISATEKTANEAKKWVENAQRDSTAILGIFAAIVLAFTGGMTFSTSILQNMAAVSIYRLLAVGFIISFTLINVIYILVYFISQITSLNKPSFSIWKINILITVILLAIFVQWRWKIL